jgi:hypothetical protein
VSVFDWRSEFYRTEAWQEVADRAGMTREQSEDVLAPLYLACYVRALCGEEMPTLEALAFLLQGAFERYGLGRLDPETARVLADEVRHNADMELLARCWPEDGSE